MLDEARDVRPGEQLDSAALALFLAAQAPALGQLRQIRQFPGGYSNLTYALETSTGHYVLRRPPFGANIQSAHDMGREYRVLAALHPIYGKVPQPLLYCEDPGVIGAPFYVMSRVQGLILRSQAPQGLALGPELMGRLSRQAVATLAELHSLDLAGTPLATLGRPEGYVQRQVEGWIGRYEKAQTDPIEAMSALAAWMRAQDPRPAQPGLVHNDFKYDNLVLDPADPARVLAVLDWEMATLGDPLMDLGTSLGYWLEAAEAKHLPGANLTWLPGNLDRDAVVDHYAALRGIEPPARVFYYVYGVYKIAVILQQIYARYRQGHTQDPRFAKLIEGVRFLAHLGTQAIGKGRISRLL